MLEDKAPASVDKGKHQLLKSQKNDGSSQALEKVADKAHALIGLTQGSKSAFSRSWMEHNTCILQARFRDIPNSRERKCMQV